MTPGKRYEIHDRKILRVSGVGKERTNKILNREITMLEVDDTDAPPIEAYCWTIDYGAPAGPFYSIKECKEDILTNFPAGAEEEITICRCDFIDPAKWAGSALDQEDILVNMDELLLDAIGFEEQVFDIPEDTKEEAQAALNSFLRKWASLYVETGGQWSSGVTVAVTSISELEQELEQEKEDERRRALDMEKT